MSVKRTFNQLLKAIRNDTRRDANKPCCSDDHEEIDDPPGHGVLVERIIPSQMEHCVEQCMRDILEALQRMRRAVKGSEEGGLQNWLQGYVRQSCGDMMVS